MKWICLLVGSIGGVASIVMHFTRKNQMSKEITKIPPTTTVKSATSMHIESEKKDSLPVSDSEDNNNDDGGLNIPSGKPPKY